MKGIVLDKTYVGSVEANKMYLGSTLIYQADNTKCKVLFKTEDECTITLTGIIDKTLTNCFMGEYEVVDVPAGVIHYRVVKTGFYDESGSVEVPRGASYKNFPIVMYPKNKLRNRIRVSQNTNTGGLWLHSEYIIKTEMNVTIKVFGSSSTQEFTIPIKPDNNSTYYRSSFSVSETGYPNDVDVIAVSVASDQYYNYEAYS